MAHRTWCDNCSNEIHHEPDEAGKLNPNWKPDTHVQLVIRIVGTGKYPVDMDLCGRCAKAYVKHLSKPLPIVNQ